MKYGYARVSSLDQNLDRQLDILKDCDEIFCEKISGAKTKPELMKLIDKIEKGDIVISDEVTRLGRSMPDLVANVNSILTKGGHIKCLKEGIDTTSMMGEAIIYLFGVMGNINLHFIRQRTTDGLKATKSRGVKLGREYIHLGTFLKLNGEKKKCLKKMSMSTYYKLRKLVNDFKTKDQEEVCKIHNLTPGLYDNYQKILNLSRNVQQNTIRNILGSPKRAERSEQKKEARTTPQTSNEETASHI